MANMMTIGVFLSNEKNETYFLFVIKISFRPVREKKRYFILTKFQKKKFN